MTEYKSNGFIWRILLAVLLTLSAAYYQRKTGPTYPVDGNIQIDDQSVSYHLLRTHAGDGNQPVDITLPDSSYSVMVMYRRYNLNEPWIGMKMERDGLHYYAELPHQPPAGKIEYFILIDGGTRVYPVPQEQSVITRFRGDVPWYVLIPHIFCMFFAMLLSTTAGLEAIVRGKRMINLAIWTTVFLFIGGMILGPVVQKFAFNAFWTGFPFGKDLTDNKTLIALLVWVIALWRSRRGGSGRIWIIIAAIILLLVFSIPHSLMGSEYNYNTMQVETG